jgi:dihydroorotate dehydrogenase electron transfer subunit
MVVTKVLEITDECDRVKTFRFKLNSDASPGQFVMVWVPGVDEIPMSLSYTGELKGVTVEAVGTTTHSLHKLTIGDRIGIRGPLGNGFVITGRNALVVGGGSGMASLAPLVERLCASGGKVTCVVGARTETEHLFVQRVEETGAEVHCSTDDGSAGHKGPVTSLSKELLSGGGFDQAYACGPELMLLRMVEMCREHEVPLQCSLERYMKCGIGLCGSCQLGSYTVCKDGPVFDSQVLAGIPEFGMYRRAPSGLRVSIG